MDEETIQRAQRGGRDAQAALLRALQDPWFRMAQSLLADSDRAREATQETAVRFLRLLPTFRGESKLQTWSMGIVINVAREMRRARQSGERSLDPIAVGQRATGAPDEEARRVEESDLLRRTLAELPERQREAVVLRYFEELSVEETAAAMNCAPGTVKATVFQAMRALREKLKQLA